MQAVFLVEITVEKYKFNEAPGLDWLPRPQDVVDRIVEKAAGDNFDDGWVITKVNSINDLEKK